MATEVRRCPLRSEAPRLRPGAAHSARELLVEARRCPLPSGASRSGPALPTAICGLQLRSGAADCNIQLAKMTAKMTQRGGRRGEEEEEEEENRSYKIQQPSPDRWGIKHVTCMFIDRMHIPTFGGYEYKLGMQTYFLHLFTFVYHVAQTKTTKQKKQKNTPLKILQFIP